MKNRVMQILLLAGLVSCQKNVDSLEVIAPQFSRPLSFISSDTLTENEMSADGRTYVTRKYWLTSASPVDEGSSVTVKMNTSNVAKGVSIAYSITGIDTSDITAGKLSGNFIIGSNGTDSLKYNLKADSKTEGTEVMKVTAKTITLSISVDDVSIADTTAVTPATSFTLAEIPYSDADFLAPFRGANTFYNSVQTAPIPDNSNAWSMDNEKRFTWSELQPTSAGVYNWSSFDAAVNSSIDKGQRFSFGIMPLESGSGTSQSVGGNLVCFPTYLHTAMQSESVKDWVAGGMWIPNWNSETYLSAWETFLKALADHINASSYKSISYKNVISRVGLLGFGNWGEWHTSGAGRGSQPSGAKATAATLKRIAKAHITAFPDYPLQNPVGAFASESYPEVAYYLLTAKNNWGEIGWSSYHLGSTATYYPGYAEQNAWTYNGVALKDLIMNKWKTAPIGGEPMNSQSEVTLNGLVFGDLERQVRLYHVSQFNNQTNYPSAPESTPNLRAASKACGYRLSIKGGSITGKTVTLNWSNSGIAPVYENWDVYLEVRNGSTVVWSGLASFKPKLFLPGTTSVNTTIGAVAAGTYSLYVIVKDPLGYRKPLPLANTSKQADGSYKIADVKI